MHNIWLYLNVQQLYNFVKLAPTFFTFGHTVRSETIGYKRPPSHNANVIEKCYCLPLTVPHKAK